MGRDWPPQLDRVPHGVSVRPVELACKTVATDKKVDSIFSKSCDAWLAANK